ncbi:MAG: serine/threonine protein kinase [Daejeonella sp.]
MGKIFTIAEGLENMGALRTGGQGSVYKARRTGEIITAVKLLPTPIHSEDKDDKNYRDFLNEVEKLKKVNEVPNPNVVKILSSGLTESGSFPFIEMEFIEGPDLQELLEVPNEPVFSIPEVIKVANQLSNALAHCHKVGVKHGDIKSNNVKFNAHTGNYILLDFGLAVMSDEQRRTSLRHAGAIEFMAPEQNEGQMLFQSDVYSFGVILYELLAGSVPFPLNDKGETARNKVMISHMETPVPDALAVRMQNLPQDWTPARKESEMRVPEWLLAILAKCLEKEPSLRFPDGVTLHQSIINKHSADIGKSEVMAGRNSLLEQENKELKASLLQFKQQDITQERSGRYRDSSDDGKVRISRPLFIALLLLLFGSMAFAIYSQYFKAPQNENPGFGAVADTVVTDTVDSIDPAGRRVKDNHDKEIRALIDSTQTSDNNSDSAIEKSADPLPEEQVPQASSEPATDNSNSDVEQVQRAPKYTLSAIRAYFYTEPLSNSRTNNFLAKANEPELTALDDKNGFIYVIFFTSNGQVTKGWLRKRDLRRIGL